MTPDIKKLIDSMELSDEKRQWIEQYAEFHAEAEKNPIAEEIPRVQKDFFEIPEVMKAFWDNKTKNVY
jgi:hypothetical protein